MSAILNIAVRLAVTLAFMALLAALSLVPGTPLPGDSEFAWALARTPPLIQNVGHVLLYGVLVVLWVWTLERTTARRAAVALVIAITFGACLEIGQLYVPGRFGSLLDVGLNALGAVGGSLARRAFDR